ncbi:MAG: putative sulfate exporter family transporter [Phycisphaeraceae bacterium]|nr:putative sulfate exporter family transporter [Phycisphaeraceae bacterium]
MGTAIHDTSQVAGAGLMYQQQFNAPAALDTAEVTKLIRNLFMVGVIPLLAILYHRGKGEGVVQQRWYKMVPLFVLGFVAMTLVRTIGDMGDHAYGVFDADTWHQIIDQTKGFAKWCLMLAMAAVGLGTSLKRIIKMGLRPFAVGFGAAALVGVVSFLLTRWFGPMI